MITRRTVLLSSCWSHMVRRVEKHAWKEQNSWWSITSRTSTAANTRWIWSLRRRIFGLRNSIPWPHQRSYLSYIQPLSKIAPGSSISDFMRRQKNWFSTCLQAGKKYGSKNIQAYSSMWDCKWAFATNKEPSIATPLTSSLFLVTLAGFSHLSGISGFSCLHTSRRRRWLRSWLIGCLRRGLGMMTTATIFHQHNSLTTRI